MTLKEKMEAKLAEIAELKSAVEDGDEEAAENLAQAVEDAQEIQDAIEEAEKADELLKAMGTAKVKSVSDDNEPKTLGAFAAKHLDLESIKGKRGASTATPYFKEGSQTWLAQSLQEVTSDRTIDTPDIETPVRDSLGRASIDGNAYEWVVVGDGGLVSATSLKVAEGELKPEWKTEYGKVTKSLETFAGWFKETEQMLEDNAYLVTAIENDGVRQFKEMRDDEIAAELATILDAGVTVTGPNAPAQPIKGQTLDAGSDPLTATAIADLISKAMTMVKKNGRTKPDAVYMTPEWAEILRTGKDDNQQYYGGGYRQNAYGNGGLTLVETVWQLPIIETEAIDAVAGTGAIVGNFKLGAKYIDKNNGGVRVSATNSNEDDFLYNLVTVRLEERGLVAVRAPKMFCLVTASE